jgi:hypothetical protein
MVSNGYRTLNAKSRPELCCATKGGWILSLKRLQEIDDLLFTAGAMVLRGNLSICNNGPFGAFR